MGDIVEPFRELLAINSESKGRACDSQQVMFLLEGEKPVQHAGLVCVFLAFIFNVVSSILHPINIIELSLVSTAC